MNLTATCVCVGCVCVRALAGCRCIGCASWLNMGCIVVLDVCVSLCMLVCCYALCDDDDDDQEDDEDALT